MITAILNWLYIHFGVSGSGPYYGFWSGPGSDIGEVVLIGALWSVVRRHNCHEPWCWRVGRFPVEGTPWHKCKRHHPHDNPGK